MTKKFGSNEKAYPSEMRTQNWPMCCGAKIISGFKDVGPIDDKELVTKITDICDNYTPDLQIFAGETINPALTFLTLNASQMQSKKITDAVREAGFKHFASGTGRNAQQGFWFRDKSNNFRPDGAWSEVKVTTAKTAKEVVAA